MIDVKFGACEWALPGNGAGSIQLAREVGLDGLELGFVSYEKGFLLSQKWFRDYYKREGEKYEIAFPSLAICEFDLYGLRNPRYSAKGRIAWEIIDMAVEASADLKMEMIMMPSFVDGFIESQEDLENTAKALQYACDLAEQHGITIASENLLTPERNRKLFAAVDRENLKAFYDSQNYKSNLNWEQAPMLEALYPILYPEIHVKDGIGREGSSRLLGEGDTDFAGTIKVLKKRGYKGWIHLENFYSRAPLRDRRNGGYIELVKEDLQILKDACKE